MIVGLIAFAFSGALLWEYDRRTKTITSWLESAGVFPPQPKPIKNKRPARKEMSYSEKDLDIMARTIWGEARGEGYEGMQAVANVIMNRVKSPKWPNNAAAVCLQKWQFSVWNENDPNRGILLSVNESNPQFVMAKEIARKALNGSLVDITGGADHYLNEKVTRQIRGGKLPGWADMRFATRDIGDHKFFRLG